jgi:hypothetical protein
MTTFPFGSDTILTQARFGIPNQKWSEGYSGPTLTKPNTSAGIILEISKRLTYDLVLVILHAYKLTGHFPTELEIVLKHLGATDKVFYEIKPKKAFSDSYPVMFWPKPGLSAGDFQQVIDLINDKVGACAAAPWWARLLGWQDKRPRGAEHRISSGARDRSRSRLSGSLA